MEQLLNRLTQDCGLDQERIVLVGVSGGADSICLLDQMHQLGFPLVAAHFNHGIRPDANQDAERVQDLCITLGISILLGNGDALDFARSQNLSLEEAARIMRYRFLFEQAEKVGAQAVAVAHQADDQVETVLMHLLRGAGLDGLMGMSYRVLPNPWSMTIPLVRPFLDIWKDEIDACCVACGLVPLLDTTNLNTTYFRNRIRHHLLPALEDLTPGIRGRLWQMADLLKADHAVIQNRVDQAWEQVVVYRNRGVVSFHQQGFLQEMPGVQRRLIRRAVSHCRADCRDIESALVQRAMDFIQYPTRSGLSDLGLGVRIILEAGCFTLATWEAQGFSGFWPQVKQSSWLCIPGELKLAHDWWLRAEVVTDFDEDRLDIYHNQNPYQVWVDLGENLDRLLIRGRVPGERFMPFGMGGKSQKLSDFMINNHMPKTARDQWPLVLQGEEIVWIPGYRLAHPFRLSTTTTRVIHLTLNRTEVG